MLLSACWIGLARGANFFRTSISLTDCHPGRRFSYSKGMRSGVEGPAVLCMDNNGSGNKSRSGAGRALRASHLYKKRKGGPAPSPRAPNRRPVRLATNYFVIRDQYAVASKSRV